jgi:hypothetical protein
MQCERLIKQIKSWYVHVREETMAPARMVSFIEQHAETCEICLMDPDLKEEIAKITEMILPESKIPKAVRQQNSKLKEQEEQEEQAEQQAAAVDGEEESSNDDLEDDEEEELEINNDELGSAVEKS